MSGMVVKKKYLLEVKIIIWRGEGNFGQIEIWKF